jgi:hypothetical protein
MDVSSDTGKNHSDTVGLRSSFTSIAGGIVRIFAETGWKIGGAYGGHESIRAFLISPIWIHSPSMLTLDKALRIVWTEA